jgi:signal transduction histidine kinase
MSRYPPYSGPVRALYEDRTGAILAGAGSTLARFRNGRWTVWRPREGLPDSPIQGIVEDDRGGLWAITGAAALRLRVPDLNAVPDGAPGVLHPVSYGIADGLRLDPRIGSTSPRVAKTADGRIWICEQAGVGIIDPAALRRDMVPPPVAIEQLTLDGKPLETAGGGIAFRGRELHIAYTGISLLAPERVRFRYRLEPLNSQWTDAGTRREVTYANLAPRRYRFQVAACNLDGVCNDPGAAVEFRVQPYFYQATWFFACCVAAGGLAIWGAYDLRVRSLVSRFQLVAQERARMTRDIHDSLLQGFAGVVYQLDAASRQFGSSPEQSKQSLDRALDLGDQALREARELLSTLRLTPLEEHTLPEALEKTAVRLAEAAGADFQLKVKGRVEPLPYKVQAAMYLIGREAVVNASNHAQPSHISMRLAYSKKTFRLAVEDDGVGFDPEAAIEKTGHWGLRGMRERAARAGAEFHLDTAPGKGTRIEVTVRRK